MWSKKRETPPSDLPKTVECVGCGHIIAKSRSYRVDHIGLYIEPFSALWYCRDCKPAYTSIRAYNYGLDKRYFKEMEVDRDGNPIGYTKVSQ